MESTGSNIWLWLNGEMPDLQATKDTGKHSNCECCKTRNDDNAIVQWWR